MIKKEDAEVNVLDRVDEKLAVPSLFKVIMLNDHYTPMNFVVEVLRIVFHKSLQDSEKLMYRIHNTGKALVGVYEYDIAATKIQQVELLSKREEYPLKCILEKE